MQSGDQLPTNQAELHWSIVSEDLPLIQHFRVMRADSAKGLYTIAKDSIPKSHRITKVDMEYTTNYFRVESVPVDGDPLSSTPVFVMGIDSIPPLTPEVISATIDSSGQVVLTWQANSEPDLWGYRVFRSNYDDKEYSLVSQGVMQDTVFIDTTHMTLGVENVYYQLHAADTRNNRSPFTEPIVIVKPDIVPPATPTIISFDTSPDTVKINWSASVSDDAVYHKIFKRAIRTENAWTLIEILDTLTAVSPYIDIAVEPGVRYAYTMQAVDEGGLESGPAAMKAVTVPVPKENFESINHFTAEVNKNDKTIELE